MSKHSKKEKQSMKAWLDERLRLSDISTKYFIPAHANHFTYCLGGITVIGGFALGITGFILAQYYHPHAETAYQSIRFILDEVFLGSFLRSFHYWVAQAVLLSVVFHMIRIYITGAFKRPRELNWVVGVVLLTIAIAFVFTGTVMKWDQEAVEALAHNTEISMTIGTIGAVFTPQFAPETVSPLLARLATAHISVLPVLTLLFLGAHFYMMKKHKISSDWSKNNVDGEPKPEATVPFSSHMKRVAVYGLVILGALAMLSAVVPAPLGTLPIAGIEITKPPWPFLWLLPLEDLLGIEVLAYPPVILTVLILIVPLLDRKPDRNPRNRKIMMALLLATVVAWVTLAAYAALMSPQAHLGEARLGTD